MTKWTSEQQIEEAPSISPTDGAAPAQPPMKLVGVLRVRADDPPPGWFPEVAVAFSQVRTYEEAVKRALERRALAAWVACQCRGASKNWLGRRVGLSNQRIGQLVAEGAAVVAREGWSAEEAEARVGLGR